MGEHLDNIKAVFDRIRSTGLNVINVHSLQKQVKYLGHIVGEDGLQVDPEKVASWPTPKSAQEVQQFLGFATNYMYYRRFIQGFAEIAIV